MDLSQLIQLFIDNIGTLILLGGIVYGIYRLLLCYSYPKNKEKVMRIKNIIKPNKSGWKQDIDTVWKKDMNQSETVEYR